MLSLWCYISDFEPRHQRSSLSSYSFHILSGSNNTEGHICPRVFPPRPLVDHPPRFWKLNKYAKGTADRWTVISLTIWPQLVFLANEADYWGQLMTLKSMRLLMLYHWKFGKWKKKSVLNDPQLLYLISDSRVTVATWYYDQSSNDGVGMAQITKY